MLKSLEISGFKSFAKKSHLDFTSSVTAVVGPNGSGKSNVVEAIRFVLGEQSMKSMRGKAGSDLIFKGSKTLSKLSRASVSIIFDNSKKIFATHIDTDKPLNLEYDEITISREVFTDGANVYSINGIDVRLKDVLDVLASVHIGSSGYHIISQGEADRILNASSRERRGMIEDALGLKIYQYRLKESERKLDKTRFNLKEVQALRREIAPHMQFLKKQVEKLEKAEEMRTELETLYHEYLKRESVYLSHEKKELASLSDSLALELGRVEKALQAEPEHHKEDSVIAREIDHLESRIRETRSVHDELSRKLGRIEGMVEMEERSISEKKLKPEFTNKAIATEDVNTLLKEIEHYIDSVLSKQTIVDAYPIIQKLKEGIQRFRGSRLQMTSYEEQQEPNQDELIRLRALKRDIDTQIEKLISEEQSHLKNLSDKKQELFNAQTEERELNKKRFEFQMKHQNLLADKRMLALREAEYTKAETDFEEELREGGVLVGNQILYFKDFQITPGATEEARYIQEERRKKIERYKIRLEDIGGGSGGDVLKEYADTAERDQFLVREISDLNESMKSLEVLIHELKLKLNAEFKEGIEKINQEFQNFFSIMFGGGSAFLSLVTEEKRKKKDEDIDEVKEEVEENPEGFEQGIEINVTLPHKKVKELNALSGGERSLTSIALLFAVSQVNPPPFLVLDETDAALDEANSRKYGDMIETLSKYSQLIVITHNRETMSRAQALYGVTVGSDGGSKLLSVKFDEAVAIAK